MRFAISKPKFGLCRIECIYVCTDCPLSCLLYFVCRWPTQPPWTVSMAQAALCDITPQTRIPTLLIVFCVHVLLLVGRCEFRPNYLPTGPAGHSDHPLGRTPRPPRPVCPNLPPHRPCRTLRPPPGQDSPSPQAGVPKSTSTQALQDTPTTPWTGLPIPPDRRARIYLPTGPAGHSDHPLGRTPRPPRPVCRNLHPHRPRKTLRPTPGQTSPSP